MKIGIMQPYFLPYIGYFQLIQEVDQFVLYDNIEYTKKGWINRNRYLLNGKDAYFTIPLKKASDYLDVRDRQLAETYNAKDIINKIKASYQKAPYYQNTLSLLNTILDYDSRNLFDFILNSIKSICKYLCIDTQIIISSTLEIDRSLRGQDKVIAICKELKADNYINAIGGIGLYSKEVFREGDIELKFLKSKIIEYKQFDHSFVPWLSIIDVLMFNDVEKVISLLSEYELV